MNILLYFVVTFEFDVYILSLNVPRVLLLIRLPFRVLDTSLARKTLARVALGVFEIDHGCTV